MFKNDLPKVAIYLRGNKEEQIGSQLIKCLDVCNDTYDVVGVYYDLNESANNMKRKGLNKMLSDSQNFNHIIVSDISRLARGHESFARLQWQLNKKATNIIFANEFTYPLAETMKLALIQYTLEKMNG